MVVLITGASHTGKTREAHGAISVFAVLTCVEIWICICYNTKRRASAILWVFFTCEANVSFGMPEPLGWDNESVNEITKKPSRKYILPVIDLSPVAVNDPERHIPDGILFDTARCELLARCFLKSLCWLKDTAQSEGLNVCLRNYCLPIILFVLKFDQLI